MKNKKLFHGIIAAIIFIALAIGANNSAGFPAVVIIVAMALHAGQIVHFYGRNWPSEEKQPESRKTTYVPGTKAKGTEGEKTDESDTIKEVD